MGRVSHKERVARWFSGAERRRFLAGATAMERASVTARGVSLGRMGTGVLVAALGLGAAVLAWPDAASGLALPQVSLPGSPSAVAALPLVGSMLVHPPAVSAASPVSGVASPRVEAASSSQRLTVQPDTNLTNGESVVVTGSGMAPNAYGSVLECNLTNGEPTVEVEGNAVPVGCTNPLDTIQSTSSSGGFSKNFTVKTGTIGPPGQGTDSANRSAAADAADYPCPPTPAQQASGATCDIVFGDTSGDQDTTPIFFAGSGSGSDSSNAVGGSGGAATGGSGANPVSAASTGSNPASGSGAASGSGRATSGSLPFTGLGSGVQPLMRLGPLSIAVGSLLLGIAARRRKTAPGVPGIG